MKKGFLITIFLFAITLLCGCTTDYDRDDIADYVYDSYGLQKFSVSGTAAEMTDEGGYTDYLWKITLLDSAGLTFYVVDDYGWGFRVCQKPQAVSLQPV